MESGHYYAFCRREGTWFEANDEKVTEVKEEQVLGHKNAYILFYELLSQPRGAADN